MLLRCCYHHDSPSSDRCGLKPNAIPKQHCTTRPICRGGGVQFLFYIAALPPVGKCEMAEMYGRERRNYRCWLGGQLLFILGDFLCCINPQMTRGNGREAERVSTVGDDSRYSRTLCASQHVSARRGNTRIPYSRNVPLVTDYKSILHCHGVSDKVLCHRNSK